MSHATDILNAAGIAIDTRGVERDRPTGERSMATAVKTFAAMTGRNLTETEGWLFMVCLKAARATGGAYREDDYTDMAAYAALAGESASGEAPAIKAGCTHSATITSADGLTTTCASCSMPRPKPKFESLGSAFDAELMNQIHRDSVRDANSVEYAKIQKPTPPPGRDVTGGVQPKREGSFFTDVTQWANRTIGKTETAESALLDPGAVYHPEPPVVQQPIPEFCKDFAKAYHDGQKACWHEFVTTGAGDKFDGKSLFCKHCGFTADCAHRYVQLTTGGLICADCKAPWAK